LGGGLKIVEEMIGTKNNKGNETLCNYGRGKKRVISKRGGKN